MRTLDVEAMCRIYGASPDMTQALMGLARETKARGWWHSYGDAIPAWFELYVGLEAAADHLRQYDPELIPGLLQTKAYATEILGLGNLPPDEVERIAAVRIGRQDVLTRTVPAAPRMEFIINDAGLRRSIDSRSMVDQLHHIAEVAALPNVSIRILPFGSGLHLGMTCGYFAILDFPKNGGREPEPSIVYSDNLTGALYLDKPQEVAAYEAVWKNIYALSLSEAQSKKLIHAIAKEYASP
jgi:hypothetical protein